MIANFTVGIYPSLLQNMVIKAYEVDITGATAEVGSITIPERNGAGVPTVGAGHQVPYVDTFNGLDNVVHKFILFTAGGTQLDYWVKQPTSDVINFFTPIRFKIGDGGTYTPAAGTTSYLNPAMDGLGPNDYIAFRTNYGPLHEGIHIANEPAGGFSLIQTDDVFSGDPAEEWTVAMLPQITSTPVNDSVVGKQWGPTAASANMFMDVSATLTYIPGHLRKLIRMAGSSALYKFESSDVPPVGYIFRITNFGAYTPGSAYPKVQFNNAAALYGNTTITEISIPPKGVIEVVWDGTAWNFSMPIPSSAVSYYTGTLAIGDITPEQVYTITIPNQGNTTYRVHCMIRSEGVAFADNDSAVVLGPDATKTATSFQVVLNDYGGRVQNVVLEYTIINIL